MYSCSPYYCQDKNYVSEEKEAFDDDMSQSRNLTRRPELWDLISYRHAGTDGTGRSISQRFS